MPESPDRCCGDMEFYIDIAGWFIRVEMPLKEDIIHAEISV